MLQVILQEGVFPCQGWHILASGNWSSMSHWSAWGGIAHLQPQCMSPRIYHTAPSENGCICQGTYSSFKKKSSESAAPVRLHQNREIHYIVLHRIIESQLDMFQISQIMEMSDQSDNANKRFLFWKDKNNLNKTIFDLFFLFPYSLYFPQNCTYVSACLFVCKQLCSKNLPHGFLFFMQATQLVPELCPSAWA